MTDTTKTALDLRIRFDKEGATADQLEAFQILEAAPELLAALDDLECEASAEMDPSTSLNVAILNARAALAKARGE